MENTPHASLQVFLLRAALQQAPIVLPSADAERIQCECEMTSKRDAENEYLFRKRALKRSDRPEAY